MADAIDMVLKSRLSLDSLCRPFATCASASRPLQSCQGSGAFENV
jgi:hypothetical protein